MDWNKKSFLEAPIDIIDGDRGHNYPKKTDFRKNGYCLFLSTSNVSTSGFKFDSLEFISKEKDGLLRKGKIKRKDIVLTTRGTVGNVGYYDSKVQFENIRINSGMVLLRCDTEEIHPYYLYLFLRSNLFKTQVLSQGSGSAQPQLPIGSLRNILIPWKEIDIQTKIAKVLSDLDAKIELNSKFNTELEEMAKLIYDYWFVQFDFPNANGKPYKASGGKMVFNKELNREVPDGWVVNKIKQVLKTDLGGTPSTKIESYWNGAIPWLNSGEIADFPIISSELTVTQDGINNSATTLMPAGSCVLSITRHLRPSILAVDSCVNQSVVGFFESENLKSSYVYPYLVNEIPRLMSLRTGAQQPHINKGIVDASFIHTPSKQILEKYYKLVDSKYKKIINNAFQNQKLTELRDWLLPMLMNGQVTVGEAEEMIVEDN